MKPDKQEPALYWNTQFERALSRKKKGDPFMLDIMLYPPFPMLFKKVMNFLEFFCLKRLLGRNHLRLSQAKVLDVGCGAARFSYFFFQRGAIVTGIDYVESVINQNKKLYPGMRFFTMDAASLDFGNEEFDMVSAFVVMQHVMGDKKIGAMKEINRVLKPDGRLILLESHPREDSKNKQAVRQSTSNTLSDEEWRKVFSDSGFEWVDRQNLHFFPLYHFYRQCRFRLVGAIKFLKSFLRACFAGAKERSVTLTAAAEMPARPDQEEMKVSRLGRVFDFVDSMMLNLVAIVSFFIELMLLNCDLKFKPSHTLYLLKKAT